VRLNENRRLIGVYKLNSSSIYDAGISPRMACG